MKIEIELDKMMAVLEHFLSLHEADEISYMITDEDATIEDIKDKLKTGTKMIRLRRYKQQDTWLSHLCLDAPIGEELCVGSGYCKRSCPHFKGTINILGLRFVKCKKQYT